MSGKNAIGVHRIFTIVLFGTGKLGMLVIGAIKGPFSMASEF
jgi:hypothetical protein